MNSPNENAPAANGGDTMKNPCTQFTPNCGKGKFDNQSDRKIALDALYQINPTTLDYENWLFSGMALQHAGCSVADWEQWSQQDVARYKKGECARKWNSFRSSANPVTIATLVKMCHEYGGKVNSYRDDDSSGRELQWNDIICEKVKELEAGKLIDGNYIQDEEIGEPVNWNPVEDLVKYLNILFKPEDHVGYVTESWKDEDGKYLPKKGVCDRTSGQLIAELERCNGDIGRVVGDWNKECGAWIRFNALDGSGVRDENVIRFKHCLIESDKMPVGKAYAIYKELELPIAALVHSGGKSLHAIARIDAKDATEFRARVDFLYSVCGKNGLDIDKQNRNPSRLSRMPGVTRNEKKQWLVATNIGKTSFVDWRTHIEEASEPAGLITQKACEWLNVEIPAPVSIIPGCLEAGTKADVGGGSKLRKSWFVLQMAVCIASGRDFLGFNLYGVRRKVLLCNLEISEFHFQKRLQRVMLGLGIVPEDIADTLTIANCRGQKTDLRIITSTAKAIRPDLVILDPFYKLVDGDENRSETFKPLLSDLDRLIEKTGASVLKVMHYSKGFAGEKQTIDRFSGSGILARDYDVSFNLTSHADGEDLAVLEVINRNYAARPMESILFDAHKGVFVKDERRPVVKTRTTTRKTDSAAGKGNDAYAGLQLQTILEKPLRKTVFIMELHNKGLPKDQARAYCDKLLDEGTLEQYSIPKQNNKKMIGFPGAIARLKEGVENT